MRHLLYTFFIVLVSCSTTQSQQQQNSVQSQGQNGNASLQQGEPGNNAAATSQNNIKTDILDSNFAEPEAPINSATNSAPPANAAPANAAPLNSASLANAPLLNGVAPSAAPPAVAAPTNAAAPVANQAATSQAAPTNPETQALTRNRDTPFAILDWIGYETKDRELKIELGFNGRPVYKLIQEQNKAHQPELVVRLYNTEVKKPFRREINATEFYAPVSFIRTRVNKGENYSDVVLTIRDAVQPNFQAKGALFTIKFPIPEKYLGRHDTNKVTPEKAELLSTASVIPRVQEGSAQPANVESAPTTVAAPATSELIPAAPSAETAQPQSAPATVAAPVQQEPAAENLAPAQPVKEVELTGKELPVAQPQQTIPVAPKAEKNTQQKKIARPIPKAPAQNSVPYIPPAPEMPMQQPMQRYQPARPQQAPAGKPVEDNSYEEDDESSGNDEKFEVLVQRFIGAVAQDNFANPTPIQDATLTNFPAQEPLGTDQNLLNTPANATTGATGAAAVPAAAPAGTQPATVAAPTEVLGQGLGEEQAAQPQKRAIKVDFRGAPLSEVIRVITSESKANFIIPIETGKIPISMTLTDVPWDLALKVVLETNNLGMSQIGPNIIRIDSLKKFSEDKKLTDDAKKNAEKLAPTKVLIVRLSYAKAKAAAEVMSQFLESTKREDPRIKIQADDRTNSLIVEATPTVLAKVKAMIERIDLQTPQVRIASRIMEVTKSFARNFGIAWGTPFNIDQGRGLGFGALPFPSDMRSAVAVDPGSNVGTNGPGATGDFKFGSISNQVALQLKLRALEEKGDTETLQNQSVTVQDNEDATISAGTRDAFQIAGSQTTPGSIAYVDYQLELKVTPRITSDGAVQMKVNIASNSPLKASGAAVGSVSTRTVSTTLLKKTGETAVIGGLYGTEKRKSNSGVPFLMDLPLLGALFRDNVRTEFQRELMIMITPTILNGVNSYASNSGGSEPSQAPMNAAPVQAQPASEPGLNAAPAQQAPNQIGGQNSNSLNSNQINQSNLNQEE